MKLPKWNGKWNKPTYCYHSSRDLRYLRWSLHNQMARRYLTVTWVLEPDSRFLCKKSARRWFLKGDGDRCTVRGVSQTMKIETFERHFKCSKDSAPKIQVWNVDGLRIVCRGACVKQACGKAYSKYRRCAFLELLVASVARSISTWPIRSGLVQWRERAKMSRAVVSDSIHQARLASVV